MQVTLHFSEALIRRAVKAFWWRTTGWSYFVAVVLVLGSFCYALWTGDRSWWVGVSGTILGVAVIMAGALFFIHYRGSLTRFRRMRNPQATFDLGEERFRVCSDVGTAEMTWSTITDIWRFPDFWLLFLSPAQFITLPTADLDPAAREFILRKVKSQANVRKPFRVALGIAGGVILIATVFICLREVIEPHSIGSGALEVAVLSSVFAVLFAFIRRPAFRWAAILGAPALFAYSLYWMPVWLGADASEYAPWMLIVVTPLWVAGASASTLVALAIRRLRKRP